MASSVATALDNIKGIIRKQKSTLSRNLSAADGRVNDIYHKIERGNFNAYQGYCLAKELEIALKERREIKNARSTFDKLEGILRGGD